MNKPFAIAVILGTLVLFLGICIDVFGKLAGWWA